MAGARQARLRLPAPTEARLLWFVREAWPSPATGTSLVAGELAAAARLRLTVESDRLVAFGDGMETDALELTWGQTVRVRRVPGAGCGWSAERRSHPASQPRVDRLRLQRQHREDRLVHPPQRLARRPAGPAPPGPSAYSRSASDRLWPRNRAAQPGQVLRAGVLGAVDDPQVLPAPALDAGLHEPPFAAAHERAAAA